MGKTLQVKGRVPVFGGMMVCRAWGRVTGAEETSV